ncbi:hypothetical protein M413DRAFT_247632 [Hebeloma cylindrosporum]|uniref:Uncharacterized protein n=1 Tax=Hebeloma cylindrosporum TaxID=76867 RepID=A0A0C3C1S2_HEBCY|nr:hypothetical protein M413DRAFT_247632 [Hebeloma cylindrosporum h7]
MWWNRCSCAHHRSYAYQYRRRDRCCRSSSCEISSNLFRICLRLTYVIHDQATACPAPVTVTVTAGAPSGTPATPSGAVSRSPTVSPSATKPASRTATASATPTGNTGSPGTQDDLPTIVGRRFRRESF